MFQNNKLISMGFFDMIKAHSPNVRFYENTHFCDTRDCIISENEAITICFPNMSADFSTHDILHKCDWFSITTKNIEQKFEPITFEKEFNLYEMLMVVHCLKSKYLINNMWEGTMLSMLSTNLDPTNWPIFEQLLGMKVNEEWTTDGVKYKRTL